VDQDAQLLRNLYPNSRRHTAVCFNSGDFSFISHTSSLIRHGVKQAITWKFAQERHFELRLPDLVDLSDLKRIITEGTASTLL
jgi:hypothetical protein